MIHHSLLNAWIITNEHNQPLYKGKKDDSRFWIFKTYEEAQAFLYQPKRIKADMNKKRKIVSCLININLSNYN